jgi:hypothetical protein
LDKQIKDNKQIKTMKSNISRTNRLPTRAATAISWLKVKTTALMMIITRRTGVKSGGIPMSHWRCGLLWALYLAIIIGSVLRVTYLAEYNPIDHVWSDTERHWSHGAEDLLRDDPFIMGDAILYQLYIAALAKLSLKIPALILFYTALLSLLMPWTWYRFFRELQPSRLIAVAGWAAITWLPSWNSIFGYFMQEALMLPLLGAALCLTWRARRKRSVNAFLLMVLFWTLAGLTRGICIPMAAVATAWVWWEQDRKLIKAVYGVVLLAMILGPLSYRSLDKVRLIAPHGIGQLNAIYARSGKQEINLEYHREGAVWYFGFWSPSLGSMPFEPLSDWQSRRDGLVKVYIDIEQGYRDWNAALKEHSLTPGKYLWITGENLIFLFFGESWPDSNRERVVGALNYQMRWLWAPLLLAVLIWTAICWRKQRRNFLLPAIILVWFSVQGLMPVAVNEGRYRKPLEGLLIAQMVLLIGSSRRRVGDADPDPSAAPKLSPR